LSKALIFGVGGQDGAYLSKLLLEKGYEVFGTSRDALASSFTNHSLLGVKESVKYLSVDVKDFRSILTAVELVRPDEIYNLSGQTSVGLSFEQPVEAMESITAATLNILEVIKYLDPDVKFYSAGSSECYGDTGGEAASEESSFNPCSPYAIAKSAAYHLVKNYRKSFGLYACTGILFNHESPLRTERFVTRKIVAAAARIARGSSERLSLGNINIARDWGWAPDYVDAMWRILQQKYPDDYVIATGNTITLEEFVFKAFNYFGLEWRSHVDITEFLYRPTEINYSRGDATKAKKCLKWEPSVYIDGVVEKLCEAENEKTYRSLVAK